MIQLNCDVENVQTREQGNRSQHPTQVMAGNKSASQQRMLYLISHLPLAGTFKRQENGVFTFLSTIQLDEPENFLVMS